LIGVDALEDKAIRVLSEGRFGDLVGIHLRHFKSFSHNRLGPFAAKTGKCNCPQMAANGRGGRRRRFFRDQRFFGYWDA